MVRRRFFIKAIAATLHGVVGLAVAIPGLRFLLAPLRQRRHRATAFTRIARLDALTTDQPARFTVRAERTDAFTRYPPGVIGTVWCMRRDAGNDASPELHCLQTICPHLGCAIDYSPERGVFNCPCHESEFAVTGERRFGPSARDMDRLACRVGEPDEHGDRWFEVEYREFHTGLPKKLPTMPWAE